MNLRMVVCVVGLVWSAAGQADGQSLDNLRRGMGMERVFQRSEEALVRDAVAAAVRAELRQVEGCYETEQAIFTGLTGRVVMGIQVSPSGSVSRLRIEENTTLNRELAQCVTNALRQVRVHRPPAATQWFQYPFEFVPEPADRGRALLAMGVVEDPRDATDAHVHRHLKALFGTHGRTLQNCFADAHRRNSAVTGAVVDLTIRATPNGMLVLVSSRDSTGQARFQRCVLGPATQLMHLRLNPAPVGAARTYTFRLNFGDRVTASSGGQ